LAGISQIARGRLTIADDGGADRVYFTEIDRLYLDGERLILIAGDNGENNSVYFPKRNDFTKVILHDVDVLGASWFEAFQRDGRIFTFGGVGQADLGSRFEGQATQHIPIPGVWPPGSANSLDPVEDQKDRDRRALESQNDVTTLVRYAWSLCKVHDRCGNEMRIYYDGYPSPQGLLRIATCGLTRNI
jgi:hypothetical protein